MTEIYDDLDIFVDDYVETKFGKIHRSDIPYVTMEPSSFKIIKACLFYSIFVIVFAVIIYTIYLHHNAKINECSAKETYLRTASIGVKKISSPVEMSQIKIFNFSESLPIEHIILIDMNNNVIDIDVKRNYFIKRSRIGLENRGELLDVDLGSAILVKEIVVLVDPDILFSSGTGTGLSIMLELYNFENKVWTHFDVLRKKETTIKTYYEVLNVPTEPYNSNESYEIIKNGRNREILISNENTLAIKLREFDETYGGY